MRNLNFLILSKGYRTIFLGQSLQTSSLETLYSYDSKFIFVSYLTVEPNSEEIMPFLDRFFKQVLEKHESKLIIFGPQQVAINKENLPGKIELYRSVESFIHKYFNKKVLI